VKHSAGTELRLALHVEKEVLSIMVSDNGRGMSATTHARPGGGYGLINMRERLANLGGLCEISGQAGQGTSVKLTIPLERGSLHRTGYPKSTKP